MAAADPRLIAATMFEAQARPPDPFVTLGYSPNEKQAEFHAATEYEVLYGGAAGGGKTMGLVMEAIAKCIRWPMLRAGAFRRTYDELEESLLKALAEINYAQDLGATWNATARQLRFPNRSLIRFRYAENAFDASRRQGGEYQLLLIDELALMDPDAVEALKERLRSGRSDVPVIGFRATSNPGGPGHGRVKARYIDATNHGDTTYIDTQGFSVRFIPAKVGDNPHVDAAYRHRLEAIPDPQRRAAMLDGSWDSFSGQVFSEWRYERHVVTPFLLPPSWVRYCGVDWGFSAPWAVVWCAEDEDGRLWLYREIYETQVGEHEQARRILAAEEGEPQSLRVGDPAMGAKRGEAESITSAYLAEGCALTPANNDRLAGWSRLHEYLADSPACRMHREQGWETCPRLHVFSGAANVIRTLPALPYDQRRVEDVDSKAEDHAADALRYLVMSIGNAPEFYFAPDARPAAQVVGPYVVGTPPSTPWG